MYDETKILTITCRNKDEWEVALAAVKPYRAWKIEVNETPEEILDPVKRGTQKKKNCEIYGFVSGVLK